MQDPRSSAWHNSIQFKVNLAIASVFLVVLVVLAGHSYLDERERNLTLAIDQLRGMNAFYFDSLNTLMLADAMEERDELRQKMLELPGITEVRISRGAAINDKFGEGLPGEQAVDRLDHRGLAGESVVEVGERDGHRVVTVVEPYRITDNTRGTDCMECHRRVESGTVGGAIRLSYSLESVDSEIFSSLLKKFAVLGVLLVVALLALSMLLKKMIRNPLGDALGFANAIAEGNLDNPIEPRSADEVGRLIKALGTMQGNLKASIEHDRQAAAEGLRIKLALDSSSTATTVSDADNRLIYMNSAAEALFRVMETDWQKVKPEFAVDTLVGQRLSDLLPAGTLSDTYRQQLDTPAELDGKIAGRSMRLLTGPVYDAERTYQGRVTQWHDRTEELEKLAEDEARLVEERRVAAENQRIKVALDQVSANVMLADTQRRIVYANRATLRMLNEVESDFARDIPGFQAAKLIGTHVDELMVDTSGAGNTNLSDNLADSFRTELVIGGHTMKLVANPVMDNDGTRLGTALEWTDRTPEVAVEREIDDLVEAASSGNLEKRIDLAGKSGFFRQLGDGFNSLLDQLSSVFDDIARVMGRLAEGDLTESIDKPYRGRFGQVKQDVNRTLENLEETVARLGRVADEVNHGAREISSGNENLSSRTEQQASSIEQTAASMQQLTTTVSNNADNAQQANQASNTARLAANQGSEVVGRAVEAMQQINASSMKISEIIGVIDEIAFQTNLLALNASVEAARAGEQGRGFAVVATEVRNLASRSAAAAKEIKELIEDSGSKVRNGSQLVSATGEALEEILGNVKKVGDVVAEISAASAEQSAGIDQVNRAITHIDEMTQQNAALAEETSAASSTMNENARELINAISFFKTRKG